MQQGHEGRQRSVYGETLPSRTQPRILNQQAINDLTYALSQVERPNLSNRRLAVGRQDRHLAVPTRLDQNAHAWMVGYTKKLAAAVWVGNKAEEQALKNANGSNMGSSQLPGVHLARFHEGRDQGHEAVKNGHRRSRRQTTSAP